MYSKDLICKVKNLYASGQSIGISRRKTKRGPSTSFKKHDELRIKREISVLQKKNERMTASKLKINLSLNVTKRTIQRKLKTITYSYQTVPKRFY